MHDSSNPNCLGTLTNVTTFLDESATDDNAPVAVVGGLILSPFGAQALVEEWGDLLIRHRIGPPLHIKEFWPGARFGHLTHDQRRDLFSEVVSLINKRKVYSHAASITTPLYKKHFDKPFRKKGMSLYAACFLICALQIHMAAEQKRYSGRVGIVMDAGNQHADQVRGAHKHLVTDPEWADFKIGSLSFDDDRVVTPLQAADVIAWAARVQVQSGAFTKGYEPLAELLDESHLQHEFPENAMEEIAKRIEAVQRLSEGTHSKLK